MKTYSRNSRRISWGSEENLGRASVRGGLITALGSWVRFAIQFGTTIALARILGPTEYGAAAVIVIFGAAAELLRESGFSTLVLQRRNIRRELINALHYSSVLIGLVLGAALAMAGPGLAQAFDNDRYKLFALLLSPVFLFASLGSIPNALLARNFEFKKMASIELLSVLASSAAGLIAAALEAGALALVVQSVTFMVLQAVLTVIACPWRPRMSGNIRILKASIPFLWSVSFVQLLNYVSRNVDNVLVGAFFGPRAAGLYNQAYQLMIIPLQQVNGPLQRVFIPVLSRIFSDPLRYRRFVRTIVLTVSSILWPGFAFLFIYSDVLVVTIFGEAWRESSAIFRALVFAGVAQALGYVNSWIFVSSGQVQRQMTWVLITRVLIIGSFFVGIPWGPYGMAVSYACASCLVVVPGFLVVRRRAHLSLSDLFRPIVWPAVLTTLTVVAGVGLRQVMPPSGNLLFLGLNLLSVCVIVFAGAFCIRPIRDQLFAVVAQIRGA
ncbi:PST family polysaccharide transporter [Arthrobacter sp. SLBN-112]|uniref:lipopolysaccharide biosynthesis protein n=1 Tax=Arthrobacter sp. SLBN-112 TaxID=2768452 RepID=UPI001166D9CF|nr:lipopolysaccharide biosynthesis protein [Arthrobacter sp. SLBN-112]TQJ38078.1 PST family polysaccharide transporter [Arthrobacter sp. SLBN-112]